ncbi:MAG TPA: hypothetical protein PK280_11950 [Planctomycetota bacterium]|nr:hypothetical protein [Planctomycetota bacterium]
MGSERMGPPEDLVLWLAQEFGLDTFVETGTYRGDTALWASDHFSRVITIEGSAELYTKARARLAGRNVSIVQGDSREKLAEVTRSLGGPALFWLDAHWCGENSCGSDRQCPLLDELAAVADSPHGHFIMIDDARLFMAPPPHPNKAEQWPSLADVLGKLQAYHARYAIIFDDVIVAVPSFASGSFRAHCQDLVTAKWRSGGPVHPTCTKKHPRLLRMARKLLPW